MFWEWLGLTLGLIALFLLGLIYFLRRWARCCTRRYSQPKSATAAQVLEFAQAQGYELTPWQKSVIEQMFPDS
jgi:hypothetical protein